MTICLPAGRLAHGDPTAGGRLRPASDVLRRARGLSSRCDVHRTLLRPLWNAGGCECLLFKFDRGYELCLWEKGRVMRVEACVDEGDARRKALGWFDQATTSRIAPPGPMTPPVK